MLSVLFAILFQSLHSYEHFLGDETAIHQHESLQYDLHQNGHDHQKCFVCEFTFSSYLSGENLVFTFISDVVEVPYQLRYTETPSFFAGSFIALRGPPLFIV